MNKKETKVTTSVITVTPTQASNWLMKNTGNRPMSERLINYYVDQIKRGKWQLTTDAIGFDVNNKLINGQHRLSAVVRTNKDCDFFVSYGLDPDSFNVIDTGKNRTGADILGIHGFAKSSSTAAIIKFVIYFHKGLMSATVRGGRRDASISNQDVFDYATRHKNIIDDVLTVTTMTHKEFKVLPARLTGGLYWIFRDKNRETALEFFNKLATGAKLDKDDPIYQLRKKLMDDSMSKKKFPDKDKVAWMILAWNHYRKGNKIQKLQWAGDGKTAFPKPI